METPDSRALPAAGAGDGNEGDDDEPEWQEQMGDVAGKGSEEEAGGNEGVVGTGVHDFNVKALEHLLQLRQEHLNRKNQHLLRRRPRNRLFTMNQLLPPATADQGLFSIEEERSFSLSFGRGGHYVDLDGPAGLGGGSSVSGRRRSSGSDGGLAGGVAQRTAENSAAQKVQSTVLGDMLARVREMVASAKGGEEGEGGEGHVPHDTASTLAVGSPGPVEAQGPATVSPVAATPRVACHLSHHHASSRATASPRRRLTC